MNDINELQTSIMIFIKAWANEKKIPVPRKEIIKELLLQKVKTYTAKNAIKCLLQKGYIRQAYSENARITKYVMCRNI